MPKTPSDPRSLLRVAIASRDTARKYREQAAGSLMKADTVLAAAQNERDRAQAALAKAEQDQAGTIATAIRTGGKADTFLAPNVRTAQAALTEADSRYRMAKQAHAQITDDLARASAEVVEAEGAVVRAAEAVITSEIESRCNLERINQAIAALIEVDEEVFGLGGVWIGGRPLSPSPTLTEIFSRLEPLRNAIAQMRPERPILSPPPEQTTARRLESYRTALTQNADAQLADVPTPVWTPPKPPSVNIIEKEREGFRARIAAAG